MDIISPISGNLALFPLSTPSTERMAGAGTDVAEGFKETIQSLGPPNSEGSSVSTAKSEAAQKFEVMVLTQFISEVFRDQPEGAFGEGMQGDFHNSLYAEAIAKQLVEAGGLGIVELL